jgi:hypothetical protein
MRGYPIAKMLDFTGFFRIENGAIGSAILASTWVWAIC